MAKQKKKSIQKKYRITFYEEVISEWEDKSYEILNPIEVKVYTKKQAKYLARKHLRNCGKWDMDNKYGSVAYKYTFSIDLIGVVSEEEKLKDKEKRERKKNNKKIKEKGYEQLSLFDTTDEDK